MRIKERPKETRGEGEGVVSYKERYRSTVVEDKRIIVHRSRRLLKTMTATASGNGTSKDEVVQRQRVQGSLRHPRTLGGLIDHLRRRINAIGIVASSSCVLDVVPRLELLETLGAGIVDVLSIGDEMGRRRSVGGRHFEWRTG